MSCRPISCLILAGLLCPSMQAYSVKGCQRIGPFEMRELLAAEVVVIATAVEYERPHEGNSTTNGVPDSTVRFQIHKLLRGRLKTDMVVFPGYLGNTDDFNDVPVPYHFVRPNGRSGMCFANTYKRGAEYLLFLRHTEIGLTPYWSSLGPTNEQLHGFDDPWVSWTERYLKRHRIIRRAA